MEQCYQNNNLVCQQIRNTMNYHQHKFNVYEQHFGIPNNILPTCTVPPNPFNLWFPQADPYYTGLFQYTTGTVYRLDVSFIKVVFSKSSGNHIVAPNFCF